MSKICCICDNQFDNNRHYLEFECLKLKEKMRENLEEDNQIMNNRDLFFKYVKLTESLFEDNSRDENMLYMLYNKSKFDQNVDTVVGRFNYNNMDDDVKKALNLILQKQGFFIGIATNSNLCYRACIKDGKNFLDNPEGSRVNTKSRITGSIMSNGNTIGMVYNDFEKKYNFTFIKIFEIILLKTLCYPATVMYENVKYSQLAIPKESISRIGSYLIDLMINQMGKKHTLPKPTQDSNFEEEEGNKPSKNQAKPIIPPRHSKHDNHDKERSNNSDSSESGKDPDEDDKRSYRRQSFESVGKESNSDRSETHHFGQQCVCCDEFNKTLQPNGWCEECFDIYMSEKCSNVRH